MRVYEAIVKGLESARVDTAVDGNGENVASLTLALRHSSIPPIMTRHEQAASFMACGYAMYGNKLGVCFATVGSGAFNLFSGLAVALSDSYPALAITGFVSLDSRGRGAVFEAAFAAAVASGRPSVIDAKITRWALPATAPHLREPSPVSGRRWKRGCSMAHESASSHSVVIPEDGPGTDQEKT